MTPAAPDPDLFAGLPIAAPRGPIPLAESLRPTTLDAVIGQEHLLGPDGLLTGMLARASLASLILWGPPGVGKTTIARLLAERAGLHFVSISAVFSGVADLKRCFDEARQRRHRGTSSLLFVDEIHRFNRAQQDGFLPVLEDGTVILVGATTENPAFALNGALLSRCQVLVLTRLDDHALDQLLARAEQIANTQLPLTAAARHLLCAMADGDGRALLNMAEQLIAAHLPPAQLLDDTALTTLLTRRAALYDRNRDEHYNLISALHKSMRGSDADAALYWLARMLVGGEDGRYLARRLVRFATEDIGLADPQALTQALAAWESFERLGNPEGELALAQAVLYLATAPKSNAITTAFAKSMQLAKQTGSLAPPAHAVNAPTKLMRDLGYGAGYAYDHDSKDAFSGQNYFPDNLPRQRLYAPSERGFEATIRRRLEHWDQSRTPSDKERP